jgi:hypothetical protein
MPPILLSAYGRDRGGSTPIFMAGSWRVRNFPTLRLRMHNNCLPAARCIRATLLEKMDDLQFALLRIRILIRKISPVTCLAVQHGSGGAFGGDGS